MKNIFVFFLLLFVFTNCTKSYYPASTSYTANKIEITDSEISDNFRSTPNSNRIVIYNANLDLVIKNPDSCNVFLTQIASKYGGYVQTLGNTTSVIRVKSDQLNLAIADISAYGKIKNKLISGEDITDKYTDLEIRLDNALKARNRYLELLAKAENVEAALKVEKELERLNGEIDAIEGQLSKLKHLSSYSTITVYMKEKIKPGILGYIGIGLYSSIKWLFVRN